MVATAGGVLAALAWVADASLLLCLLAGLGVVLLGMRDRLARQRLAPLLIVLAGIIVIVAAADPHIRTWI